MVRPVSTEVLQDICTEIARQNYGFVYLNEHKGTIKEQYTQMDTGLKYSNSVSLSDIQQGLGDIAENDVNSFEQLRGDAYFLRPFGQKWGGQIGDELEALFTTDLVLHKKRLESRFDIAPADVDFFARELLEEGYIDRVPAGERDYFVGGPKLRDETNRDIGLEAQLQTESNAEGKLSHRDLEEIIDVAATENVIDYLSKNDFIIDLDGEFLVQTALDEFAASMAERIETAVVKEFREADHVLHRAEFETVVENNINDSSSILKKARSVRQAILEETETVLQERLGLEEDRTNQMIIMPEEGTDADGFQSFVDQQAKTIQRQVARSDVAITKRSEMIEAGDERIADLQVGRTERARQFIHDEIRDRYEELVDKEW